MAKKELTPKQKLYKEIDDIVDNYKTKYKEGFLQEEIVDIVKGYPDFNWDKFNDAMMGNTCMMSPDGKFINYHCDVRTGLLCGIENRDITFGEWD